MRNCFLCTLFVATACGGLVEPAPSPPEPEPDAAPTSELDAGAAEVDAQPVTRALCRLNADCLASWLCLSVPDVPVRDGRCYPRCATAADCGAGECCASAGTEGLACYPAALAGTACQGGRRP